MSWKKLANWNLFKKQTPGWVRKQEVKSCLTCGNLASNHRHVAPHSEFILTPQQSALIAPCLKQSAPLSRRDWEWMVVIFFSSTAQGEMCKCKVENLNKLPNYINPPTHRLMIKMADCGVEIILPRGNLANMPSLSQWISGKETCLKELRLSPRRTWLTRQEI